MRLIAEIGSDASQFRNDVGQLPTVVKKSFGEMKSASEGGIGENIKGLKKGFTELRELVLAGGIVEGVRRFFDVAIETAKKSTDANDANAAAVRRFGEAIDAGKESFGKLAVVSVGTFNQIGEGIGTTLKGLAALFTGTWDKWRDGEQTLEETEKAARKQELAFAEMKKHADEFKELNAQAKQLAEEKTNSERKALALVDQRAVLEQKLLEAQRAYAESDGDRLKMREAEVTQMRIQNQLAEVRLALEKESRAAREAEVKQSEAAWKADLQRLPVAEQIKGVQSDIAALQATIASGVLSIADKQAFENRLNERKLQLIELQGKEHDKEVEFRKASALDDETRIKVERIMAKSADARTQQERDFLKLTQLQTEEKQTQAQIQILLAKYNSEGLTPAEEKNLQTLIKQADKLHAQVDAKEKLISNAAAHAEVEKTVTDEYQKQVDEVSKLDKIVDGYTQKLTRVGSEYSAQSTTALEGVRERMQTELTRAKIDTAHSSIMANGQLYNPAVGFYASELEKIDKELSMRAEVNRYARQYGQEAAVRQYGDEATSRAFRDLQDTSTKTANAVSNVSEILERVFPKIR